MDIPSNTDTQNPLDMLELLLDANRVENGWQRFLDEFKARYNLLSCHLYIANIQTMAPRFQDFSGPQASELQLKIYMEKYFKTDYTHLAILKSEPNTWYASNLMPNYKAIQASPAYTEWAVPNGIKFVCGTTLFREDDWSCVFVHNRSVNQPEYTKEEVAHFQLLGPYIEKAIRLRIFIAEQTKNTTYISSILNQFNLPTASLNEFGEVIAKNTLMDKFLEKQDTLDLKNKKNLMLNLVNDDKNLQMSIAQTISKSKQKDLSYYSDHIPVKNPNTGDFVIGLQELIERQENSSNLFIGALIFIIEPKQYASISPSKLISLFSLSEAESQVACLFCSGLSLKEIALQENKSTNTVREQIQSCFKKTRTKNQVELISLLTKLPINDNNERNLKEIL